MGDLFADARDVEARWRPLSEAESDVADQLLQDASDMIRERWPDIESRVASGGIAPESLTRIVAQMVKRAMINVDSEGLVSQSQGAGPFSLNQTYANPTGNLYLASADVALLDGLGWTPRVRTAWLA